MNARAALMVSLMASLLAGGVPARAQQVPEARVGSRVRVETVTGRYTGTLLFSSPDSVVVQPRVPRRPFSIPAEHILYAEASRGRYQPPFLTRTLQGAGLGLALAAVLHFAAGRDSTPPPRTIAIGVTAGISLGAFAGLAERQPELWHPVRLPARRPLPPVAARTVESCVVSGGRLMSVRLEVQPATGDTTFQGQPFRVAFPLTAEYAQEAEWYRTNEPIPESVWPQDSARGDYVKYGPPRVLRPDTLVRIGTHHGVGVFAALDDVPAKYGIIYVPIRPGCWFHFYQFSGVGEVRGG